MLTNAHAKNFWFLLIASLISCSSKPNVALDFTTEEVRADLGQLHSELQSYHAGYDWYSSKASLENAFQTAIDNANASNGIDIYRQVRKLTSLVRCGHTRASIPE